MESLFKGILVSGSLIIAIGAQNAYVLKNGLLKKNVFWVSLTCFLCDVLLMTIGVMGLGSIISSSLILTLVISSLGTIFLLWYAFHSFSSAFKSTNVLDENSVKIETESVKTAIFSTLAITLLNPHVYLDTVVVVGGIAGTMSPSSKIEFLAGALTASFMWFFGLGYGSRLLLPLFKSAKAWRILEFTIGCMMLWIAFGLLLFTFNRFI